MRAFSCAFALCTRRAVSAPLSGTAIWQLDRSRRRLHLPCPLAKSLYMLRSLWSLLCYVTGQL